ncbi:transposase [Streptomyces sp. NPDC006183]|uniref:transposase n=1 Tax=Streptomyces sp. NPDC006183 TaxID=3154580 RepID=UPI0033AB4219
MAKSTTHKSSLSCWRPPRPATCPWQAAHHTGGAARRQGVLLQAGPRRPRGPRHPHRDSRACRSAGQPREERPQRWTAPDPGHQTYKRRNVVERSFSLLKQRRGPATRYDKLAIVQCSAAVPAAMIAWLRS